MNWKGTKGEVLFDAGSKQYYCIVKQSKSRNCIVNGVDKFEVEQTSTLITDAFNTIQISDKMPSQLLEETNRLADEKHTCMAANGVYYNQNKELLTCLKKMCEFHEKQSTWDKGNNGYYEAKQLINKIENGK